MAQDKIKRSFVWIRKTLGIIDKTTLPGEILGEVRPILDMFGWERLLEEVVLSVNALFPAVAVASATPPVGTVRLILAASLEHGDVAVNHIGWIVKRRNPGATDVGLSTDRTEFDAGEFLSLTRPTFLQNNDFLVGEIIGAPAAGNLSLRTFHIDLDPGEYVPPIG